MIEYSLPDGWEYVSLGDIADVINGVSYKPDDIEKDGIRILRSGNIQNGYLVLKNDDVFLDNSYFNEENTLKYLDNCITASSGSIDVLGKCGTVFEEIPKCQIGAFMRLVRSKSIENALYISFTLHSPLFHQYIRKLSKNGTSINNIYNNHLEDFRFPLPPKKLKREISEWYYSIEKKNVLNTRMNAEMEAIAKQLYDYWFVQFDFPDKNGKPYKSSGGKMVWNDKLKREIPEGWEVKTLEEIENNIITGKTPSTNDYKNFNGDIPFITIDDIRNNLYIYTTSRTLSFKGAELQRNKYIPEDTLCCSCIGTPGIIGFTSKLSQTNQQINSIIFKNEKNREFICFSLKMFFSLSTAKTGNILPNMNKNEFSIIILVYPSLEILSIFHEIVSPLFYKIKNNCSETCRLTHLRDSLLPMLMNGQVTIA